MNAFDKSMSLYKKVIKLRQSASEVEKASQTLLDSLVTIGRKKFKKDQILKKKGSIVFVKVKAIVPLKIGRIPYPALAKKEPYVLECYRCTKKGAIDKEQWIFINGCDFSKEWEGLE